MRKKKISINYRLKYDRFQVHQMQTTSNKQKTAWSVFNSKHQILFQIKLITIY